MNKNIGGFRMILTRALYGIPWKSIWISKYCSDSAEEESHRETYLVNDILLVGRYLAAPFSPMTLPMVYITNLLPHTLNIRAAQADRMSALQNSWRATVWGIWKAIYLELGSFSTLFINFSAAA
jgi:hypothetical protein